jgi:tetratricopeptide (TPR) repeat protein
MVRNKRPKWLLFAAMAAGIGRPIFLAAQFGPLSSRAQAPQAKMQQELDQYLKIITDASPQTLIADVNTFATQFPASELLGTAYQYQMHAYEQLGDFPAMLFSGQQALKAQPDNLNSLMALAPAIANRMFQDSPNAQLPALAEDYAHRALDGIEKTKPPRQTSLEQWAAQKKRMQSSADEVLGLVALKRGQPSIAISELQLSIQLSPPPDGSRYLRLALAFAAAGDTRKAEENFHRAAQLGPDEVRQLAMEEMGTLSKAKP